MVQLQCTVEVLVHNFFMQYSLISCVTLPVQNAKRCEGQVNIIPLSKRHRDTFSTFVVSYNILRDSP